MSSYLSQAEVSFHDGGTEAAGQQTRTPIFRLAPGIYPGTVIKISDLPVPRKPSQYHKKGQLKIYFSFLVDGTPEYLAAQGIEDPGIANIGWYTFAVSRNLPLRDDHPIIWKEGSETPEEWVKDAAMIRKFSKPLNQTGSMNGYQTLYGTAMELRVVEYTAAGQVIRWGNVVGSRAMVQIEENQDKTDTYATKILYLGLSPQQQALVGAKPDPNYLLNMPLGTVTHCRHWPVRKEDGAAGGTSVEIPPTADMIAWVGASLTTLTNSAVDEADKQSMLARVGRMISTYATQEGSGATKFRALKSRSAQLGFLKSLADMLIELKVKAPDFNSEDPDWVPFIRVQFNAASGNLSADDMA